MRSLLLLLVVLALAFCAPDRGLTPASGEIQKTDGLSSDAEQAAIPSGAVSTGKRAKRYCRCLLILCTCGHGYGYGYGHGYGYGYGGYGYGYGGYYGGYGYPYYGYGWGKK